MSAAAPFEAAAWTPEDERIPVSALEHYAYCARQCALIHVDETFDENVFTVRGTEAHERVDIPGSELIAGVRSERALPIWSDRLGLIGKADLVEFHGEGVLPVEYKVGRRRHGGRFRPEDLQLCAQALCLEEMLGVPVPRGAVFYWTTRRRHAVELTAELRAATEAAVVAVREQFASQRLPPAPDDARCTHCSLNVSCLPSVVAARDRLRGLQGALFQVFDAAVPDDGGRR
ncbi:MAG: CRISPR-associated protein Cas4 [Dehalococcoidia bacterium]|nr:CRISPR-associated protein Cas4 [Dehalococcoidia bacterium]